MDIFDLLDQDEVWVDQGENEHLIEDMDSRYCRNVVRFLERKAEALASFYVLGFMSVPMPNEDTNAFDIVTSSLDREINEVIGNPKAWLMEQPLLVALKQKAEADMQ